MADNLFVKNITDDILDRQQTRVYLLAMSTKQKTLHTASSWAVPSDEEIRLWEALPRDKQLARLQALFESRECNEISSLSFFEIVAAARLQARSSRGWLAPQRTGGCGFVSDLRLHVSNVR